DTAFEDNRAVVGRGGALYVSGGAPVLRRVAFRRNELGVVTFADGSEGVVEDAVFEQNTGPSAAVVASSPVFRRATFRDNVVPLAGYDGAGALIDGGAPRFEDCLFERLRTRHDFGDGVGGGVRIRALAAPASPAFVRTTFRDNTANTGGGAAISGPDTRALFLS